jgi:hypothetical protein
MQQIFPGPPTHIWRYQGEVIKGPSNSLSNLENSYLGPIFNIKTGTHLRVHFKNELPEKSSCIGTAYTYQTLLTGILASQSAVETPISTILKLWIALERIGITPTRMGGRDPKFIKV